MVGRPAVEALPHPKLKQMLLAEPQEGGQELDLTSGRTLYASVSPIIGADGEILGKVCVLRDVTHFKELDAMKSEFVATVSHDLRAPLTFMRGYATMLPMVGQLTDKQREFADKIILGIEQMTKLIDALLDLARIEQGVGLSREPCRLGDIVGEIVESVTPHAVNRGLNLTLEVQPSLPSFSGDSTLLRQAFMNLVDNAMKYTPAGGYVKVALMLDTDKFRLAVSDSGLGISPADQTRLFQKFYRADDRLSRYLLLADDMIVRQVVEGARRPRYVHPTRDLELALAADPADPSTVQALQVVRQAVERAATLPGAVGDILRGAVECTRLEGTLMFSQAGAILPLEIGRER